MPHVAGNDRIKDIVRKVEELPAPPAVATRIINWTLQEDPDIGELARLVKTDQSLTLKILKLANSPAYGLAGEVTSVDQAAVILGIQTLRTSLLGIFIRDCLILDGKRSDPVLAGVWRHSLMCAVAADVLAQVGAPPLQREAFAAGMVHDCGKLVLLSVLPEQYEAVLRRAETSSRGLIELEGEFLGTDHVTVGKWLLRHWGMPEPLVVAAWLHHQPVAVLAGMENSRLAALTALADILAREILAETRRRDDDRRRADLLHFLNIEPERLDAVKKIVGDQFAQRAELFDFTGEDASTLYFQALQRAGKRLDSLAMRLELGNAELGRHNRMLGVTNAAARRIAAARDTGEVLSLAVEALRGPLAMPSGCLYCIDSTRQVLEGLVWRGSEAPVAIRCPLDERLEPGARFFEETPVPEFVRAHLDTFPYRIPPFRTEDEDPAPSYSRPFYVQPLLFGQRFMGELLFEPASDGAARPSKAEFAAVAQFAGFLAATLDCLSLTAQLEERSEHLSSALRKVRQANQQLLQAERLAAVGQLAAGAAHEINNPLAIIYARLQILGLKEQDGEKRKSFQQMEEQIGRISSILTRLMDFARPTPPSFSVVDPNAVCRKVLSMMESRFGKDGIAVRADLRDDIPTIRADAHQLEQVLLNLFLNALHAMEGPAAAGESCELRVRSSFDAESGVVRLRVEDTGTGIPEAVLGSIFDPFFTTKDEGKGTGLGLSTSYGIVKNHGGDIHVETSPGKGSTFVVELPLNDGDGSETEGREAEGVALGVAHGADVLVVDDEHSIREIMKEALEAEGYSVALSSNGDEALERLADHRFRLVLMDIRMPRRNGLSLLAELSRRALDLPVIVVTGLASREEMEEARRLGAAKVVKKPFDIAELMRDVRSIMNAGPGRRARS